jgi:hypothetical protein
VRPGVGGGRVSPYEVPLMKEAVLLPSPLASKS